MSTESDQADVSPQRFDVIFAAESVTRLRRSEVNQFFFIKMQSYASTCRKKKKGSNKTVNSAEGKLGKPREGSVRRGSDVGGRPGKSRDQGDHCFNSRLISIRLSGC